MKPLFIRVFFIIFTTISCLCSLAAVVSWRYAAPEAISGESESYIDWAEQALDALGERGIEGFNSTISSLEQQHQVTLYLIAPDGYPIGKAPEASLIRRMQDRAWLPPHKNPMGRFYARALSISYIEGDYRLILLFNNPLRNYSPALLLFAAVLAITLAAGLISWHITQPLRRLKLSARAFAQGQLDVQVAPQVLKRQDAIGELAVEFQSMAARVGELLNAQRELMRNLSHELRTPLARLEVACALAQKDLPENSPHLQRIERESQHLDTLIDQVLAISRLQTGAEPFDRSRQAINPILAQISADAGYEYYDENRRVCFHSTEPLYALIDAEKFASAIENIVRNAMRYTPNNGTVTINAHYEKQQIVISIEDQGPGVDPQDLPFLFLPFFKSKSSDNAQQFNSYGIGLAIAKGVIERHQGQIKPSNRLPTGLKVEVIIPSAVEA